MTSGTNADVAWSQPFLKTTLVGHGLQSGLPSACRLFDCQNWQNSGFVQNVTHCLALDSAIDIATKFLQGIHRRMLEGKWKKYDCLLTPFRLEDAGSNIIVFAAPLALWIFELTPWTYQYITIS